MKMRVQVLIELDDGEPEIVEEVLCVQRGDLQAETLGRPWQKARIFYEEYNGHWSLVR